MVQLVYRNLYCPSSSCLMDTQPFPSKPVLVYQGVVGVC